VGGGRGEEELTDGVCMISLDSLGIGVGLVAVYWHVECGEKGR